MKEAMKGRASGWRSWIVFGEYGLFGISERMNGVVGIELEV